MKKLFFLPFVLLFFCLPKIIKAQFSLAVNDGAFFFLGNEKGHPEFGADLSYRTKHGFCFMIDYSHTYDLPNDTYNRINGLFGFWGVRNKIFQLRYLLGNGLLYSSDYFYPHRNPKYGGIMIFGVNYKITTNLRVGLDACEQSFYYIEHYKGKHKMLFEDTGTGKLSLIYTFQKKKSDTDPIKTE